jgi:hypothetical protein
MSSLRQRFVSAALCGATAAGALAVSTTPASAYVACNSVGECWHVRDRYTYPAVPGIVIHDDGWVFDRPGYYHWAHDRPGRGYWWHNHWRRF